MFNNLFKTAARHLLNHTGYSILNILGLTLGISSSLFLIIYVADELSYDRYNENADRIYRVDVEIKFGDDQFMMAYRPAPEAYAMSQEYPEVESVVYTRFSGLHINQGDKLFWQRCFFVGEDFFKMFSFQQVT